MKTYTIKITGSGTVDQLAVRLIEIGRDLQVINVYGGDPEREEEDSVLFTEITED